MKLVMIHPDQIEALLPQTQCQLCEYPGCKPYATAIAEKGERIDKCLPGGVETLEALAALTGQDPAPYRDELRQKTKPAQIAVIREDLCIGCTKCLQACPTDAIIGSAKQMHTIIAAACTGCELCLPPCPMDCIDIRTLTERTPEEKKANAIEWKARYEQHQTRLSSERTHATPIPLVDERKTLIEAARARAKARRGLT